MKIIAPNNRFDGVSAGVDFKEGVGQTSDPYLISWFEQNGYTVEGEPVPEPEKPSKKGK